MGLASAAGIALALLAGFTRNRRDHQVHGPADAARDFPIPLLGVVPLLKSGETIAEALSDPQSPLTEAHHAISLALEPITGTGENSLLLLTSSSPDEGKSTIAFKLAANLAAAGKNVLLIDGDMRRGSLHDIFGIPNDRGLADLLSKDGEHHLSDAVRYCGDLGFSVLPRGHSSANPAELLASSRFGMLLKEASVTYEAVIIDGPPVLGLADAPRLSRFADATVFVLEANRTSKDHAKIALKRLGDAGAEQIGLVISKYDPDQDIGASDYAYRYDYGGDEEEQPTLLEDHKVQVL
jgi:capsular exopolysaccharide synthesis family protein